MSEQLFEKIREAELVLIKDFMDKCPEIDKLGVYFALSSLRNIAISCVAIEYCFKERDKNVKVC